jgi:hypothetical protein
MEWCHVAGEGVGLPSQGWKIHVSASPTDCIRLCHDVLEWLISAGAAFKVCASVESILFVNSGLAGASQIGKVVTVYPRDDRDAAMLATELDVRWPSTAGPVVPSDLAVRRTGAIFLRYGSIDGESVIDRFGQLVSVLRTPDGSIVADSRREDGQQVGWAQTPLTGLCPAVPDWSGPFQVGGDSYLPLVLLQDSPRGRVFSGLALSDASDVLMKVVPRGVGTELLGSTQFDRLHAEFSALQLLKHTGVAPQPIGYCKGPDFSVLITEHVDGTLFADLDGHEQIARLCDLAAAVDSVHRAGFVHRDIKLANALVTGEGVRLIDFELAARTGSVQPSAAGTHGYVPPEARPDQSVAPSRDIFAVGVCVAHSYLGFDPGGIPDGGGRLIGLLNLIGYGRAARIARRLLDVEPQRRPSASSAARMFVDLPPADAGSRLLVRRPHQRRAASWAFRAAWEAGLATRLMRRSANPGLVWKARRYEGVESAEGINIGSAGVVLGLASIDQASGTSAFLDDILGGATYLAAQQPYLEAHGLFTGNAGVAVALAVAGLRLGREEFIRAAKGRLVKSLEVDKDCDLFSGLAGVTWAACLLGEILDDPSLLSLASGCGARLMSCCEERDDLYVWPPVNAKDSPLTGAAHGSAGIAMSLAIWGRLTNRPEAVAMAIETFERIFRGGRMLNGSALRRTVGTSEGSSLAAPILAWCHGIAGYLWCMLTSVGDHARLASAIDWSAEQCAGAGLSSGVSYCHGLAGELELWRLCQKFPRLSNAANPLAERTVAALRLLLRREEGLILWSSEDPNVVTPDLWVGFLGPASALALYAQNSKEPLLSAQWLSSCAGRAL